jgi:ferrous iron transport protein A
MSSKKSLSAMRGNQAGVVAEIRSGFGLVRRLDVMGIRPGTRLEVTSRSPLRGPVTVRVGNAQIALGFGMAGKIIVETCEEAGG